MCRRVLCLQAALSCCINIQALRTFGSSTAMGGLLPQQLHGLQQLRCLSVYGVGPAVELVGISRLTQLTALSLTFELPDKRSGRKLMCQVGSLPQLRRLAVSAKLLCEKCCPGATNLLQVRVAAEPDMSACVRLGQLLRLPATGHVETSGCHTLLMLLLLPAREGS
jgi:hypothetical protein